MAQHVNTKAVKGRRTLKFLTLGDANREVQTLIAAENAGTLKRLGNWELGQTLHHLATWVHFAFDGYPVRPPFLIRVLLKPFKKKFLRGPLPAGLRIPNIPGGTLGIEPVSTQQGLDELNKAFDRLEHTMPVQPHPIVGPMTHDEWIQANLRHAELHLGYFLPA
ncbi:MAG: DUF1569 domain-containing protein [Phycisphaerales bacterium]|nr:MAG: DUF1569 domain-containing protein [Phycisphaerales bacterium]